MEIRYSLIFDIFKKYDVVNIEQHLVLAYIRQNSIQYNFSQFLLNYVSAIIPNDSILNQVCNLDLSDIQNLENYMELLIPSEDRKVNGAFFTPSYIVDYIINEVRPTEKDRCIDPSCGCGAFLVGLVKYYCRHYDLPLKQVVKNNISGADILDYNVRRAKLILALFAAEYGEYLDESDFNIFQCDSLRNQWDVKYDIVVGNPPYVKFQDMTEENRDYLISNWSTIEKGTFNLYFAFFELGYKLLSNTGKLGYITPNNYFTSLSGESLRKYFQQNQCVTKIVDFGSTKVFDAQTYTAITFISKDKNAKIQYDRITKNITPVSFLKYLKFSDIDIDSLNAKKWRLAKSEDSKIIKAIETSGTSIGSLFDICVGIATLRDSVYFIEDAECEGGYYLKRTPGGLFRIESEITRSVFKISDFKCQQDTLFNKRRIIFPYSYVNGIAKPIYEDELSTKYPECYRYLLSEREVLAERDKKKKTPYPFYLWGRSQGLNKSGIRLLTPTFSQFPRFLLVKDEYSFFTNGYGLFAKEEEYSLFSNPISNVDNFDVVQKILNSIIMHYYVSKTSVAIEGGYPCYQKNFIEKFSIPNMTQEEIEELRNMDNPNDIDEYLSRKYHLNLDMLKRSL